MAVSQYRPPDAFEGLALDRAGVRIGVRFGDDAKDGAARRIFVAHVHASSPDHSGQQVLQRDVLRLHGVEPVDEFVVVHVRNLRQSRNVVHVKVQGEITR